MEKSLSMLVIMTVVNVYIANVSMDLHSQVEIMISVQRHFHSGCLFLVQSQDSQYLGLGSTVYYTRLTKLISSRGKASTFLSYHKMVNLPMETLRCLHNRPIYVLTSHDNATRCFLKELERIPMRSVIWLMYADSKLSVVDFFADIYVTFDSEFLIVRQRSDKILLTEVYKVDEKFPLQENDFAVWTLRDGLISTDKNFYNRRDDMQGLVMKGVTHQTQQYTILKNEENKTQLDHGYFSFLWNEFQRELNFRTRLLEYTNKSKDDRDRYCAMVGMLIEKNLDVAIDSFPVLPSFYDLIDYTTPSHNTRFRVLIRPQGKIDVGVRSYLGPFSGELWCAVGVSILVLTACLALFHHVGRVLTQHDNFDWPWRYTFPSSLFYMFGIFCQQGHEITPRSYGCRLLYWMAYLTSIVILAAYSGTLISFLAIRSNDFPFEDLEGLVNNPNYKIGTLEKYMYYFEENQSTIMYEVYKKKMITAPIASYVEGLQQICKNKFVFWASIDTAFLHMDKSPCVVLPLPKYEFSFNVAMVLAKNSPYRIFFNHLLAQMRDSGILRREHQQTWYKRSPRQHDTWSSVSLVQAVPLLIILALGTLLSILTVIVEILLARIIKFRLGPSTKIVWNLHNPKSFASKTTDFRYKIEYNQNIKLSIYTLKLFQEKQLQIFDADSKI